jgi:hypothetical protein
VKVPGAGADPVGGEGAELDCEVGERGEDEVDDTAQQVGAEQQVRPADVGDEALEDEGSDAGADADGAEEEPEAARFDAQVALGEHDQQSAGRAGGQRGERLDAGEGGQEPAAADDLHAFDGLGPAALVVGSWSGGHAEADERCGGDEERGGVDSERGAGTGPGDNGAGDGGQDDLGEHGGGPHGGVGTDQFVFVDEVGGDAGGGGVEEDAQRGHHPKVQQGLQSTVVSTAGMVLAVCTECAQDSPTRSPMRPRSADGTDRSPRSQGIGRTRAY